MTDSKGFEKEKYYKWVEENDCYPKHSHQFVVMSYTGDGHKQPYRNFGPFPSAEEAKAWFKEYKKKYTKQGFIKGYSIVPMCEVKDV